MVLAAGWSVGAPALALMVEGGGVPMEKKASRLQHLRQNAESCSCDSTRNHPRCSLINQGLSGNSFEVDVRPDVDRGFCIAQRVAHLFTLGIFVSVCRSWSQTADRRQVWRVIPLHPSINPETISSVPLQNVKASLRR